MKKISFFLAVALLLGALLCIEASGAAKGKMSLSGSMTSIKHGDTVTLTVELNQNPGVERLRCTVGFDPLVLDFVSAEGTETLPNFSFEKQEAGVLLRWGGYKNTTATGQVAHITLRVKDDAVFGDSAVTLNVSEKLYDAQNAEGEAVPFETSDLKFLLLCPHRETVLSIQQPATFETEGVLKKTCSACENVTLIPLPPAVNSCDGRVSADVAVGEFSNGDTVQIYLEDLYGTDEEKAARETLGENLYFTFRIRFTKNGEAYVPARDCSVQLTSDFPMPEETVLYALAEGGTMQPKSDFDSNTLHFEYDDVVFALVARPYVEPVIPTTTTTTTTTAPPSTADPFELERQKDLFLIFAGVAAVLVCGTGAILILSRRKRY